MKKQDLIELARQYYSDIEVLELEHAIDVATVAHEGQRRKSGEPYIIHPLAVASYLIEWDMDIDTVVAGVLHDTVEDTGMSLAKLETLFGRDVAFLVDGVTKVGKARSGMRDLASYLPQTKDNLTKLLIAVGQDVRVIIIKLADRLHNMRTLKHQPRDKQKKIARETLEVFAPLADRLNMGRVRVALEELSFRHLDANEFEKTKRLMDSRLKKSQRKLEKVRREIANHLNKEKIEFQMDGRVKSIYSLYKKLDRLGNIDLIYDLIALRIIVDDIPSCYLVLGEIHRLYSPLTARIKDYIAQPKVNGYQSLHTTVVTQEGLEVEFQVRTQEMHEYSERGLAAGFHYNEQKMTDAYRSKAIQTVPEHMKWIQNLQKAAQNIKQNKEFDADAFRMNLFADRIFVNSPKGDIYDLPIGALPLDYAYRVHSDVAARASGFKINGTMKPFDCVLQHGDVIEVLTSKSAKPKADWLNLVVTPHAKDKLKAQLNKNGGLFHHISNATSIFARRKR